MRASEWIQASFAAILAIAAWMAPLEARRRSAITLLAICALVVVALARLSAFVLAPVPDSILRDWLPVPLLLVPYWQTGQFFVTPNEKIQAWLLKTDLWLLSFVSRSGWSFGRNTRLTLEWAYMLCYPLVPLGLAALYIGGLRRNADTFWFLVLVPTYLCYAITPFVPALPPRSLNQDRMTPPSSKSRIFSLWILKHGSIQAISFPSAHVASALSISFVLLHYLPIAGGIFLAITFWISLAAVVGRYHYAIDVVLGAMMALAIYMMWHSHLIPNTLITAPAMTLLMPF